MADPRFSLTRRAALGVRRDGPRHLGRGHQGGAHTGPSPRPRGRRLHGRELRRPSARGTARRRARHLDRVAPDALDCVGRRGRGRSLAAALAAHAPARAAGGNGMSRTDLLRDRSLVALLVAEVISTTGAQMTWLALPWFVLVTTGSATQTTFVVAAEVIGLALLGLPGGRVLARLGSRRTMMLCDAARAPVMLVIPLLHWSGGLPFPIPLAVAFAPR